MSTLKDEIGRCIVARDINRHHEIQADFRFPCEFTGFKGHFPDNPILPGLCIIQSILVLFEKLNGNPVSLRKIVRSKFFLPITPNEIIHITCSEQKNGEVFATVSKNGGADCVAKVTVELNCKNGE